jgi:type I restriction enzyme S subunit
LHYTFLKRTADGAVRDIKDELPFEIPDSWEWVRLNGIGEIIGGGTPKTEKSENWTNGNIPWLTPADMKNVVGKYVARGERNITEYGLNNSSTRMIPENAIIDSSRAPIGYIAIASNPLCTNQGFKSVVLYYTAVVQYIYYSLIQRTSEIQSRASGTTFKETSGSEFGQTLVPIPPLAEQARIVTRIEKLLPHIDDYATAEKSLQIPQ